MSTRILSPGAIVVTPQNYIEAEVDITFTQIVNAVGSHKFRHDRSLIPLDQQPAVTMNYDTVYSFGIYYAPKGTTITLPKSKDDRYQWDVVTPDGDLFKSGVGGQGLWISPSHDAVVVFFSTGEMRDESLGAWVARNITQTFE